MKLTVLGCNGPYPEKDGGCSAYLLREGDASLLLDCGTGTAAMLEGIMPAEKLNAVCLSHLHFDHMSDMFPLAYRAGMGEVPVYAPDAPADVRSMLDHFYQVNAPVNGLKVGPFTIDFFATRHPVKTCAVRVTNAAGRVLCYTGDTNTCDGLAEFVRGADLLLADACFTKALWTEDKPHLSAFLAAELAASAGAKRLVLTHFRPGIDRAVLLSEAREAFPGAVCAEKGMEIDI